jgi:type VI secretion system protein ImpJ
MGLTSKPLWSEGMLVRPQHFQQYDRWIEHVVEGRVAGVAAYSWGLRSLTLSTELLPLGRIGVQEVTAVLPDGTLIDAPSHAPAPAARAVPPVLKNALIKIGVSVRPLDGLEVTLNGEARRYEAVEQPVRDATGPERPRVPLRVGRLSPRILFEGEAEDDLITMPVARLREVDAAGSVVLDPDYVPPCLDIQVSARLTRLLNEVRSLLKSRGEALASRADPAQAGAEGATLVDLLLLSIINGASSLFDHLASARGLHPELLYRSSVELAGRLSTFTQARRPIEFPPYRHDDLDAAFAPILHQLRQLLAVVIERNAVALPLQERGYGIRTSTIADRSLFQDSRFVLVAHSALPSEALRAQLPTQMKIGAVEQIRDLVNLQLPGVPLRALPVAPRELPFVQGGVYFELDQSVELWRNLLRSAAFAFHVSGDYPELRLEFWAIRSKRG